MRLISSNSAQAKVIEFPISELVTLKNSLDAAHGATENAQSQQILWGVAGFIFGALVMSLSPFFH